MNNETNAKIDFERDSQKIKDMVEQCWRHPEELATGLFFEERKDASLQCLVCFKMHRRRGSEREKEGVINKNITIKIELYSRPGIHESWRKRAACRSIQHVSSVSELTREFATTRWSFHHCDLLPSQFSPSLFFAVLIVSHHYQLNNRIFALHIFLHYLNHMQLVVKEMLELKLAKKIVIQSDHFAVYIILFAFLITARHQHIQ